jgi:hypothetical protein
MEECKKNPSILKFQYLDIFDAKDLDCVFDFLNKSKVNNLSYEKAIEILLETSGSSYALTALNRFLAFTFSYGDSTGGLKSSEFENRSDLYTELINKLSINNRWNIVSLNYDVLFEQALKRHHPNAIPFNYEGIPLGSHSIEKSSLKIFKIHGSINWFGTQDQPVHSEEQAKSKKWTSLEWNFKHKKASIESVSCYTTELEQVLYELAPLRKVPIMAHYTASKFTNVNIKKLEFVRDKCLESLDSLSEVYIVGVKPPTQNDDEFLFTVFKKINKNAKQIIFVNNSETDCQIAKTVFFPKGKYFCNSLLEWVRNSS